MVTGGVSFWRDSSACQKRMSNPGHADKFVIEEELGAYLGRGRSKQADLQINESFPQRACVFVGLGCEAEADAWRCSSYRGYNGPGKKLQKRFAGANGESLFELKQIHLGDLWPENRSRIVSKFMDAVSQFGRARRRYERATGSDEQRIARCRSKPCERPAHGRGTQAKAAGRSCHTALGEQYVQRNEKVQVYIVHELSLSHPFV